MPEQRDPSNDDQSFDQHDSAARDEALPEIHETERARPEDADIGMLRSAEPPHIPKLQTYMLIGIGVVFCLGLIAVTIIAIVRPELEDFLKVLAQTIFAGLIGIGGTVTGYLFANRK